MLAIKFKKEEEHAVIPSPMSEGAMCFDLTATKIEIRGDIAIIYFGLACEIPKGYGMTIQPRSSFTGKGWVQANSPGQIDSDYRGELQMRIQAIPNGIRYEPNDDRYYLDYPDVPYNVGDRAAQAKIVAVVPVCFEEAETLEETVRGTGGFGSTGT